MFEGKTFDEISDMISKLDVSSGTRHMLCEKFLKSGNLTKFTKYNIMFHNKTPNEILGIIDSLDASYAVKSQIRKRYVYSKHPELKGN